MVADVSAEKVIGGAERMLVNHLRALVEAGHEVTLLSRQSEACAALQLEVAPGVVEHRLPYSGERGIAGLLQLWKGARAWWREHHNSFDMVVSEQPFTMWALLRAGCRLPRLQVIHSFAFEEYVTRHGLDWNWLHRLVALAMRRLEANVYSSADHLEVLSKFSLSRLKDNFGLPDNRVSLLPGGVRLPEPMQADERAKVRKSLGWHGPVIVTLRNLVPRTGVDMLVQAASMLSHEMPDVRWCVMGAGGLLAPLKCLAGELGVDDRVEFTGFLPEEEVMQRMQAADAFMLPTRSLEGFGLVTIEANACGLPVVATPVGANPEVVSSIPYNVVADTATPLALACSTREVLEMKVDHSRRASELRSQVARLYAWSKHDQAFLNLVEAIPGNAGA